jgi:tetratricopeptide (TPR) repeat protein
LYWLRLMTKPDSAPLPVAFVTRRLPWWLGGGALLFYLVTLNPWISPGSLETIARLAGWQWQPDIGQPLTLVVFAPLKLLPAAWRPWLANFITALVAALVLQQLARSVAILRQDVAPEDRLRKKLLGPMILSGPLAWLPSVFAALVCGLQLSFWEHATAASGELLSLLCFAVAFRCVLEFRLEPRDKWLYRAAFGFALGMTDNWLMVGYLPAFIAAVIWVRGYGACLNWRFLLRMTGAAGLGLSLYLLVPTLLCLSAPEQWRFGPALKAELAAQKQALQIFRLPAFRLLVLTAVLPFGLLAVKWRSHTVQLADDTHLGVFFSKASGHFIHALFFLAAIWIAFEPALVSRQVERPPLLLLYQYTWALVAGHCAGYLLLFRGSAPARRPVAGPGFVALALLIIVPLTLGWKSFGDIRLTNAGALRELARQQADDLPAGKITVLSDELRQLMLLRAELVARDRDREVMLVDTRALPWVAYHQHLTSEYGTRWPEAQGTNQVGSIAPAGMLAGIQKVAANEPVVYLHPSSGFFFEDFRVEPQGWIQQLKPRQPANAAHADEMRRAVAESGRIWQQRWTNSLALLAHRLENQRRTTASWGRAPWKSFRLANRANETATLLAGAYTKVLNHWGVQAQRAGGTREVQEWFDRALQFDPDNLSAQINREFITRRQRGATNRLTLAWLRETHPTLLARYERWADVISRNGPVDEPTFLFHTGRMYLAANNPRQAWAAFARSAELEKDWLAPQLAQAQCHNVLGQHAAALALTDPAKISGALKGPACAQWLRVRATALWRIGQTNEAVAFTGRVAVEHPQEPLVLLTAAEFLAEAGRFEEEIKWREVLLRRDPKRLEWIVKKGLAELRANQFEPAIMTLTQALMLEPKSAGARLFRAVAALRAGKLEDARRDYQELLKYPAQTRSALFGLGSVAWRERDTNAMILYYQAFLTNSAVAAAQAALVNQRLKDWQDE